MYDGLRIVFDPAIDPGGWPGPLGVRTAALGELWLGPQGLVDRLELELGLGGRRVSAIERTLALVPGLAARSGWWSESALADPLGTAQRLLRDRDLLAIAGWQGEPAGARLDALWQVTADMPGLAERLLRVAAALATRSTGIAIVDVRSPIASLPRRWRDVLAALARNGVDVIETVLEPAAATGDLARARSAVFEPSGDGSLVLLRSPGVLAAADEVAASLAARDSLDGVVIVGGDRTLDAALARHGLPQLGASGAAPASTALLRLVVEAAFEPMEPADLHALLCLDPGPIPRRVASRLLAALDELPSRRSAAWREALASGLARCDDSYRDEVATRLALLLAPAAPRTGAILVDEMERRFAAIATWAYARFTTAPSLLAVARLADDARRLVRGSSVAALSLVSLRRLCDELDDAQPAAWPAQAGLGSVAVPGAILAPARHVVWWHFTRDGASVPPRFRLTRDERALLRDRGIAPLELGAQMEAEATRWRRPLELARESLVLVCPTTGDGGEPSFPHPLWDELRAAMPSPSHAAALKRTQLPGVARQMVVLRSLPVPRTSVTIATPIPLRDSESPSSLETLLGCSLRYALHYPARLRGGRATGPGAPSPMLFGKLAHAVLARIFGGSDAPHDAEAAVARALLLVDDSLAELCETLALPRYQVERTTVRQAIVDTARAVGRLLAASGARIAAVEQPLAGRIGDLAVGGIADLILEAPGTVLDLKWGRSTARDKLVDGSALQLAVYASLRGVSQVGYLTLQSQELLGPVGTTLPGFRCHGSAGPRETLEGALVTLGERRRELASGQLFAPAADGTEVVSGLAAGRLAMAPGCNYCDYAVLCGAEGCA